MSLRDLLAAFGLAAPAVRPSTLARQEMMRRFGETIDRHAVVAQRVVRSAQVQVAMIESNPDAEDVKRLGERRADILDAWVKGQDTE